MEENDYLDYDDDMDKMLDDELEIMRELEQEAGKENEPTSRRSLFNKNDLPEAEISSLTCKIRSHESNVNIGNLKRTRTSDNSDEDAFETDKNIPSGGDEITRILSPVVNANKTSGAAAKRARVEDSEVLSDIGNVSTFSPQTPYRVPRIGERKVYRRIPLDSDYVSVTAQSGDRFYLRMKATDQEKSNSKITTQKGDKNMQPSGLCGVPFWKLQLEAEQELDKLKRRESEDPTFDSGIESSEDEDNSDDNQLWVEKFKPRGYMDLLSDVGTNRTLLKWLKLWDKLVFGKEVKPKVNRPEEPGKFQQILPEILEEFDELNRPKQKVALLYGPPGLGKTTLAHIVARHAGYNVVEMNASDDRSVDAFKKKVESSTQMRSLLTGDKRPNCLIIDEIDGAPAPTINYLVSILSNKPIGKKKEKKQSQILRPVICICNELYTPSLRPLRQMALVVPFPPTSDTKLADRLKEIAIKEKMSTDLTALLALCKKSENDIRSCLSTLQFFNRKGKVLRASDVSSFNLGTKDTQKSLFNVWSEIFSQPLPDQNHKSRHTVGQPTDDPAFRFKNIQTMVARSGETDRIMTGVFENYLSVPFKNIGMERAIDGTEWFCHYDMIHQEVMHSQNYSIMGHLNFPLVKCHFLYCVPGRVKISFPTQAQDLRKKIQNTINVLESITNEMVPRTRAFSPTSVLVRDLLPFLMTLVQPVLRPINTQLYSVKEKADLKNLVNIHIAYNINYQQERNLEGQYDYRMDPDVETVVSFPGVARPVQLSYAAKQLISHEIELEKMRRMDAVNASIATPIEPSPDNSATPGKRLPGLTKKHSAENCAPSTPSHLQKLTPKQIVIKERQATDFFGRVIKKSEVRVSNEVTKNDIVKTDIWFKFKEGYSNAVRRNVRMKDFL